MIDAANTEAPVTSATPMSTGAAVRAVLEYMDGLGLVKLSAGMVKTQPRTIVERATKLPAVVAKGADDAINKDDVNSAEIVEVMTRLFAGKA